MWEKSFDFLVDTLIAVFLPLVHLYYGVTGDLFLNVAAEDAQGLEKAANQLLVPYQYVFSGRSAVWNEEKGIYEFSARFPVDRWFWPKMTASLAALPASFVLGGISKAASFLSPETQNRYAIALKASFSSCMYKRSLGLRCGFASQEIEKRPL